MCVVDRYGEVVLDLVEEIAQIGDLYAQCFPNHVAALVNPLPHLYGSGDAPAKDWMSAMFSQCIEVAIKWWLCILRVFWTTSAQIGDRIAGHLANNS